MARYTHDVIIVGGGSGGLTAAVGCAQLGMKTALIDKERLGGDCLHYGCVPSKTLLKSASVYAQMREADRFGLPSASVGAVEMSAINARIAGVIAEIEKHDSPERFESLGAEVFLGHAEFTSPHEVRFNDERTLSAKHIILATGSAPRAIPFPGIEEAGYITNLDAFSLPQLPRRIATIGAGPIGIELSQAYRRLGAQVTILDLASQVLPREDADMAEVVSHRITAEGIQLRLGAKIERVEKSGSTKTVHLKKGDGSSESLEVDEILMAVGRQGNTTGLGLENIGVTIEKSFVVTDSKLRTSRKNILGVGDVNGKYQFTHVAGAEGSVAVRRIALHAGGSMNYTNVPWVTYTDPELASVGYNEGAAKEAGITYRTIVQPFGSTDRAQAEGETEGRMKILLDRKDRVIGTQIVGYHAGELLAPSLYAVGKSWKASAIMGPIYPYPTLAELHKKAVSGYMGPRLFNDKVRGILRFLFRYRGNAGKGA
jgi:pyruvate/2-oxoglutarate dehydrogenase complex dihydrolipoamide dehydrogenase (E3) component